MKKLTVVALVMVAVLVASVTPALAAGNGKALAGQTFMVVGEVGAVDTELGTVTVTVGSGNYLVKDLIGTDLTVLTDDNTKVRLSTDPAGTFITLAGLAIGDPVNIKGVYDATAETFLAQVISVVVPEGCRP
jgi:hypothetical protein